MARTKKAAGSALKAKTSPVKVAKSTKAKKAKAPKSEAQPAKTVEAEEHKVMNGIVIEACKQCNAFKTRALKLQSLLKEGKSDLAVSINPEKPRKGCFEVRNAESGEQYVSLLDMPRPFPPLKALDIDELGSNILSKLD